MKQKIIVLFALTMVIAGLFAGSAFALESQGDQLRITLLNQDPDPVQPGEYVDLRFKIEKTGDGVFENITFMLPERHPISFDESADQTQTIGDWAGYMDDEEYYILHYEVFISENTVEEEYELPIRMSTNEFTLEKKFTLRVDEKTEVDFDVGAVQTSPETLYEDSEDNKVSVDLLNTGDDTAQQVIVDLKLPDGFDSSYGYSTRDALGTIAQGASGTADFYIDIAENIASGSHTGTLEITYTESDDTDKIKKTIDIPFDIPVHGKPGFVITNQSFTSSKIESETSSQMYVTVKNTGEKSAKSVSLRIYKEASQPFEFDKKSDFIGHLEPGESGTAVLDFTVDEQATPKEYLLDSEVRGVYNEEVIVDEQQVSISVLDGKNTKDGLFSWQIPAVITLLLMIVVGYFAYKTGLYERKKGLLRNKKK
ncbi:MAG: COG1361 S-layer family protein [Nanobdellota archaeon]